METDKEQPEKQEEHLAEYGITEAKREKKSFQCSDPQYQLLKDVQ